MKSAYELAMERLAAKEPVLQLSADQKQRIAAIEAKCKADIAAKELLLQSELAKTLAAGAAEEAAKIQRQLTDEIRRFEEKREREKDAVRSEA
jgi:ABC-type lipoprotein export system ATPase subunit